MLNSKLLGNLKKGLLFVISAPAGTGKSTLVDMLLQEFPEYVKQSCSATTRPPRLFEIDKQHYQFISEEDFKKKISNNEFLEYATVFGNLYGTLKSDIEGIQNSGKHAILVIDTQGAMQIKEKCKAITIFIAPPNFQELKRRLVTRKTESDEKIRERLEWAKKELSLIDQYDYHIVNEELNITYEIIRSIFIAEEHRRKPCQ